MTRLPRGLIVPIVLLVPGLATGGAEERVDYLRAVKPLLVRRCQACHGVLQARSGLRVDTAARLLKGGDGGPAVVPGRSDESPLIAAVTGSEGWRMPPEGGPLSAGEIATLRAWIDQGAQAPGPLDEPEPSDPRRHWSFRPPVRPDVPAVPGPADVRNPIDAFLAAEQARRGVRPGPPADRATLLRRVAVDLTGLVPTPEELRAFRADPSEDAYEQAVDRLLASPHYGERWGRHWMDVWRYADWDGFGAEVRESQPHLWRWRDWIVGSLNADLGYDRMVVAMLAADEAAPEDVEALRATGFLARNWYKFNRNVWLDNTVEHTSKAFLGLTFHCAKCHDHKYDPLGQVDYYRLRAFFEPHQVRADRVPGQADTTKDGLARAYDADAAALTFLFDRGDEKRPVKDQPLTPGLPRFLAPYGLVITPVDLPPSSFDPDARPFVQAETLAQAEAEIVARKAEGDQARRRLAVLATVVVDPPARAFLLAASAPEETGLIVSRARLAAVEAKVAAERARDARPPSPDFQARARAAGRAARELAFLQARADQARAVAALDAARRAARPDAQELKKATAEVEATLTRLRAAQAARTSASANDAPLGTVYPATSTGRRLALARWLTERRNPLTARVAVNHLWMRHFGAPLVPTVFDFGLNGKPPTHPALLDWLAVEFMEQGWSMKALHRLIVTSAAYRRSSATAGPDDPNRALDPENQTLGRMNVRRMEAELIRDNVLRVGGGLDERMRGPDIDPAAGLTVPRRSLYFRHAKEKRVVFLKLFDSANVLSCYRRTESVMPQQALALANSPLTFEQARRLTARLVSDGGDDDASFIQGAFEHVLGRPPEPDERAECAAYLTDPARPNPRAREGLIHALFNHNDFVTIR